jgi:serine protease inhibitor
VRKAAIVLGVVGGLLGLWFAIPELFKSLVPSASGDPVLVIGSAVAVVAGIVGIVGGAAVSDRPRLASFMLLASGALGFAGSFYRWIAPGILLILAGIFCIVETSRRNRSTGASSPKRLPLLVGVLFICLAALAIGIPRVDWGGFGADIGDPGPLPSRAATAGGAAAAGSSPQAKALAQSLSTFGFDLLLRQAGESTGNVTMSPVSLASVLSMIRTGALGDTQKELAQALGVANLDPAAVNQGWADLIAAAQSGKKTSVTVFNSLWLRQGIPFKPAFLDLNREYYAAECRPLSNVQEINQWASDKTNGRLPQLFQGLDKGTYIVAVNTVNLKVGWQFFNEEDTYPEAFQMSGGKVDVPMMHGTMNAAPDEKTGIDNDEFAAARLKTDGPVDVWVVVPKGEGTPESVVRTLAAEGGVSELYASAQPWEKVFISLPRFDITYQPQSENLKADLQAMGIKQLFDRNSAQLQGIADVPKPFFLTTIASSARIKVDEKGVEAQAASGAQLGCGAAAPLEVIADRPFLVVLAESGSQAPLFLAIVRDPRATEE